MLNVHTIFSAAVAWAPHGTSFIRCSSVSSPGRGERDKLFPNALVLLLLLTSMQSSHESIMEIVEVRDNAKKTETKPPGDL